jgi:3-oxo-5,6-didehydrosuberyl-CoA/3-oxoadipyl-CoA thiolase
MDSLELQRSKGRYALASLCIGVGQGMAMLLERA